MTATGRFSPQQGTFFPVAARALQALPAPPISGAAGKEGIG